MIEVSYHHQTSFFSYPKVTSSLVTDNIPKIPPEDLLIRHRLHCKTINRTSKSKACSGCVRTKSKCCFTHPSCQRCIKRGELSEYPSHPPTSIERTYLSVKHQWPEVFAEFRPQPSCLNLFCFRYGSATKFCCTEYGYGALE